MSTCRMFCKVAMSRQHQSMKLLTLHAYMHTHARKYILYPMSNIFTNAQLKLHNGTMAAELEIHAFYITGTIWHKAKN